MQGDERSQRSKHAGFSKPKGKSGCTRQKKQARKSQAGKDKAGRSREESCDRNRAFLRTWQLLKIKPTAGKPSWLWDGGFPSG